MTETARCGSRSPRRQITFPLEAAEAHSLDMLKDRLLAVRFDGKPGMAAYHKRLLGLLDDRSLCRT
jgi:hypothetical protein